MRRARLIAWLQALEDGLLALILLTMLGLAFVQIVMRNLFDAGLIWSDPLLKMLVLWTALLGAMVATRQRHHITIDLLSRFIPPRWQPVQQSLVQLISAVVALLLAWEALRFVSIEWQESNTLFAGLPAWIPELILPVGFASMGLRFLLHSLPGQGEGMQ